MEKKNTYLFSRIVVYAIGLVLLSFGITLSVRSQLGATSAAALGQNIALLTNMSLGTTLFWVKSILVVIQLILTKRHNHLQILMQVPINFVSSALVDLSGLWVNSWTVEALWVKLVLMLASIPIIALGAVFTIVPNFAPTTPDGFVQTLSERFGWKLSNTKNAVDIIEVSAAAILYLALRGGSLGCVHVGTILAAIFIGRFIGLFVRLCRPYLPFMDPATRA